jgi:catechol 2,3-dioxygenase-like lactoylglutathione lyase family enzyme
MGELHGKYHHVSVCVTDLDRARAFYGGQLGLKEIPRPAFDFPGVWYGLDGDIALHIMVTDRPAPRPDPRDFTSTPTGLRQLFVDDPDGNRVEFIGPTKAPRVRRMETTR